VVLILEITTGYSFGVILWEIFHRQDPYVGKDIVAVAVDVMLSSARPYINPTVPADMQRKDSLLAYSYIYFLLSVIAYLYLF
jgi:hypothetical protein